MFNTRVHTLVAALVMSLFFSLSVSPVMAQPTSVQGAIAAGSTSAQNPVVIGGVDGAGAVRNARVSASGILSFGLNAAGQDGFTNTQIMYLKDVDDNSGIIPIAPMIFNPMSGNWDRQRFCQLSTSTTVSATGSTQIVTGTSGKNIYVCSVTVASWSGNNLINVYSGTGTVCGTGYGDITNYIAVLSGDTKFLGGNTGYYAVSGASHNLCLSTGNSNSVTVTVKYTVY